MWVFGVPRSRDLLGDQIGISEALDLLDTQVLCDAEAMHKSFLICHILLVILKCICSTYFNLSPLGDLTTTQAPEPPACLYSSKYNVH
jgi:hypothetical protein